eukprot:NODE_398_length_9374_cov_0.508895.p3 type:complete len:336 gc:universal NODE_398_length_9374_cov_0.508895:2913-3920(+)
MTSSPIQKRRFWYFRSSKINVSLAAGLGLASFYYNHVATSNTITTTPDNVDHPMQGRSRSAFLSTSEADEKLSQYAKTYNIDNSVISGISINKVASNDPIEDRNNIWNIGNDLLIGVFDGHAGYECSAVVSQSLGSYVKRAYYLNSDRKSALEQAFNALDRDISDAPKHFLKALPKDAHPNDTSKIEIRQFMDALTVASSGSCAIAAWVTDTNIHVANSGDARAIVGTSNNKFIELSHDQTPDNPAELERLQKEHPGEEDTVASRGRVLGGLMPSRSFGDNNYKWDKPFLKQMVDFFHLKKDRSILYRFVPHNYKTPPYVTGKLYLFSKSGNCKL